MQPPPDMLRRPVISYFTLTIVLSWFASILVLGPGGFPMNWERFERLGPILYVAFLVGPVGAGLLMIGLVDGRAGFRTLLARLRPSCVRARWYAIALVAPLVMGMTPLLLALTHRAFMPSIASSPHMVQTVLVTVALSAMFAFFEELGWTGFAIPQLRKHHSALTTGMIVGVVWGAWHFPLFWAADTFTAPLPFVLLLLKLFGWLPAYRVLMVMLYDRTNSLLPPMLMHWGLVMTQLLLVPPRLTPMEQLVHLVTWCAAIWALVLASSIQSHAGGRRLLRPA